MKRQQLLLIVILLLSNQNFAVAQTNTKLVAPLVELLFRHSEMSISEFRNRRNEITDGSPLGQQLNKSIQGLLSGRQSHDAIDQVLAMMQAGILEFPFDESGSERDLGFDWMDRPSSAAIRLPFFAPPGKKQLEVASSLIPYQRTRRSVNLIVENSVETKTLEATLRALLNLPLKELKGNPVASSLLSMVIHEIDRREKQLPSPDNDWAISAELGKTLSKDVRLALKIIDHFPDLVDSVGLARVVSAKETGDVELSNYPAQELQRRLATLALGIVIRNCSRDLVVKDTGTKLADRVRACVFSYEQKWTSRLGLPAAQITTAQLRNRYRLDQAESQRRASSQFLSAELNAATKLRPESVAELTDLYFSALSETTAITHDGDILKYASYSSLGAAVRPSFQSVLQIPDSELVNKLLDYWMSKPALKTILSEKENAYTGLMLYAFTEFVATNRSASDSYIEARQKLLVSKERLGAFTTHANDGDWSLFFSHFRWCPLFWHGETLGGPTPVLTTALAVDKNSTFAIPATLLNYHHRHSQILSCLLERIGLPHAVDVRVIAGGKSDPFARERMVSGFLNEDSFWKGEPRLREIYRALFKHAFAGRPYVGSELKIKDFPSPDSSDAPRQDEIDGKHWMVFATESERLTVEEFKELVEQNIKSGSPSLSAIEFAEPYEKLFERYSSIDGDEGFPLFDRLAQSWRRRKNSLELEEWSQGRAIERLGEGQKNVEMLTRSGDTKQADSLKSRLATTREDLKEQQKRLDVMNADVDKADEQLSLAVNSFYAVPSWDSISSTTAFSRLRRLPNFPVSTESMGQSVYADGIQALLTVTAATIHQQSAELKHRGAGFIFQNETTNIDWLTSNPAVPRLKSAREQFLLADTGLRGLVAPDLRFTSLDLENTSKTFSFGMRDLLNRLFFDAESPMAPDLLAPTCLEVIPIESVFTEANWNWPELPRHFALATVVASKLAAVECGIMKVDAAQDAFGDDTAIQMATGVEELLERLDFYVTVLQTAVVDQTVRPLELKLDEQTAEYAVQAADKRVYEQSQKLAALKLQLEQAKLGVQRDAFGLEARESEVFAAHFNTEAYRQLAEAAQNKAAGQLVRLNVAQYEEFALKARLEMLATALPGYTFHLYKAKYGLDQTDAFIEQLKAELYKRRKDYLDRKGKKDSGKIVQQVVVTVVDVVCTCYGLPPLGSIVNDAYDTMQAVSDGRYEDALRSGAKVASATGLDKKAKEIWNDGMEDLKDDLGDIEFIKRLGESDFLDEIQKVAKDSGLNDFAVAKSLSIISNSAKSRLPDRLVDALLPPQEHKWADNISGKDLQQHLVALGTAQGKRALGELSKAGVQRSLDVIYDDDSSKLREFVEDKLKIDRESRPDFDQIVKDAGIEARKQFAKSTRKLIDSVRSNQTDAQNRAFNTEVTLAMAVSSILKERPESIELEDKELTDLMNKMRERGVDKKEFWSDGVTQFLESKGWDKAFIGRAKSVFTKDRLLSGDFPIEEFGDSLAAGIVDGTFSLGVKVTGSASGLTDAEMKRIAAEISDLNVGFKQMIIGIQIAANCSISVDLTRRFHPQQTGMLVKVLDSWENELNLLFDDATDTESRDDLRRYYLSMLSRFEQVDLQQLMDGDTFKIFMNPPEVVLPPKQRKQLEDFDRILFKASSLIQETVTREDSIRGHMDRIYKASSDGAFSDAVKNLFGEIQESINNVKMELNLAIEGSAETEGIGLPNDQFLAKFNSPEVQQLGKLSFERYQKLARQSVITEKLLPDLKEKLEDLQKRLVAIPTTPQGDGDDDDRKTLRISLSQRIRHLQKRIDEAKKELIELKKELSEPGADSIDPGSHSLTVIEKLTKETATEIVAFYNTFLVGSQSLTKEQQALLSLMFLKTKEPLDLDEDDFTTASALVRQLIQIKGAKGLYAICYDLREQDWKNLAKSQVEKFEQQVAQHKALSAALQASGSRAIYNAKRKEVRQAKVIVKISELSIGVYDALVNAQAASLAAHEYDFLAARTEMDSARLASWEYDLAGGNTTVLTPTQLASSNRHIWKCIRDIVLIQKYYEGDSGFSAVVGEALQQKGNLTHDGIWKPTALQKLATRLRTRRLYSVDRTKNAQAVWNQELKGNVPGLFVDADTVVRFGVALPEFNYNFVSLLVEVIPQGAGSDPIAEVANPDPARGHGEEFGDLRAFGSRRPRLKTFVKENVTRSRSRLLNVIALGNVPPRSAATLNDMLFRHLGDGFLTTIDQSNKANPKTAIPLHWQLPIASRPDGVPSFETIKLKTDGGERSFYLRSETLPTRNLFADFANFDRTPFNVTDDSILRDEVSKKYEEIRKKEFYSRSAYFMFPMCGTYEILVPTKLVSALRTADDSPDKKAPYGFTIYFFGNAIGP